MHLTRRGRFVVHTAIYVTAFVLGILSGPFVIYNAGH